MKNLIELINEFPAWARLVYLLVGGKVVSELRWRTEKKLGKHRSYEKLTQEPDTSLREKSHYLERANDWAFKWLTKMRGQNNNLPKDLSQCRSLTWVIS